MSLAAHGAEEAFRPTARLAAALVDDVCASGDANRISAIERLVARVPASERAVARAHLARAILRVAGSKAAGAVARSIGEISVRSGAWLLIARGLMQQRPEAASDIVEQIESPALRQLGIADLARAYLDVGQVPECLRTLPRITAPSCLAYRQLLQAELKLVVVRDMERGHWSDARALAAAYEPPGWLGPHATAESRDAAIRMAALTRLGTRPGEEAMLSYAAHQVWQTSLTMRSDVLRVCEGIGLDTDAALPRLLAVDSRVAPILAARIQQRAERFLRGAATTPWITVLDPGSTPNAGGQSLERALFDERVALSPHVARRGTVLVDASRACLRAALREPMAWSGEVVDARIRTLQHIGGLRAIDAIANALESAPTISAHSVGALHALSALAPERAAAFVLGNLAEMRTRIDPVLLVERIELAGGLQVGTAQALRDARNTVGRLLPTHDAYGWLAAFARAWRDRLGRELDLFGLEWLIRMPALPVAPAELVDAIACRSSTAHGSHVAELQRVLGSPDALLQLLIARPASVDPNMRRWTLDRWRELLSHAAEGSTLAHHVVERCARLLRRDRSVAQLAHGDLAALGASVLQTFEHEHTRYHVRLLDKRADLLTYLRFADVTARSCYRSDSFHYRGGGFRTELDVRDAWKDPLTFCLRIDRETETGLQPRGFFFGGFAIVERGCAIVMNSLHVRPNAEAIRARVIEAFEQGICRPLGVTRVGIANANNGFGPLPDAYAEREVVLTRLRALRDGPDLELYAFDDISSVVNREIAVRRLWWRTLR